MVFGRIHRTLRLLRAVEKQEYQNQRLSVKEQGKQETQEVQEIQVESRAKERTPSFPREEINWSYLYNYTERESAVEEA